MRRGIGWLFEVVGSAVPALLLAVVLVVVTANVVARTLLGLPFYMAHDIALVALAGMVWFGAVGAAIHGQLFGVAWFVERLPPRARTVARIVAHLAVIAIALAVIEAARAQIASARFTRFLALGWPKWIVSAGLLGAMAALILVQVGAIWRTLRGSDAGDAAP
jgi:TRAP-type C4-dicarboxylate transport system permease small subunit